MSTMTIKSEGKYLPVAALVLHLTVSTTVFLIGRTALLTAFVDTNGVVKASDSQVYLADMVKLSTILKDEGVRAWYLSSSPFHVKLYSLSFALFSPLCGETILTAEPLNLLLYLAILFLIFRLGQIVSSPRASLIASCMVALWPSFLLHTTQLLKDPLFICAMLLLVFILASWLRTYMRARKGFVAGVIGALAVILLWMVRDEMWEVVLAVVLVGVGLLIFKQIKERSFQAGNVIGASLLVVACMGVPRLITPYRVPLSVEQRQALSSASESSRAQPASNSTQPAGAVANLRLRIETLRSYSLRKINRLRHRYAEQYAEAGSNIDTDVQFNSIADVLYYLPRALAVGLFSPFPQMWLAAGKVVGRAGRLLAGVETLCMFVLCLFAVVSAWKMRRNWAVWLLLSTAVIGAIALGLVVVNVGTLYRMRYVFWMLLIPLGIEGMFQVFLSRRAARA